MKSPKKLVLFLSISGAVWMNLYPELLFVKKTETGFDSIDSDHKDQRIEKEIAELLLKYQWPLCIGSQLHESEQKELLAAGKPRAEELFIEKKLREKTGDNSLGVVFIPTTLYELFAIAHIFDKQEDSNALQKTIAEYLDDDLVFPRDARKYVIDLKPIINSKDSAAKIREKIGLVYERSNALFYKRDGDISAHSYMNKKCVQELFLRYPELKQTENSSLLSDALEKKIVAEVTFLIDTLLFSSDGIRRPRRLYLPNKAMGKCPKELSEHLAQEKTNNLIAKTIALEYEAREQNKGILLRGSSFPIVQVAGIGEDAKKKRVAGSTLSNESVYDINKESGLYATRERSFEEAYKEKSNNLYSISFGNSLFAGSLEDCGACAYSFLSGYRLDDSASKPLFKEAGYALLIDKKEYILTNNANLFFISSLSPLAALLQKGEYFHSRTKAAISLKSSKGSSIRGLVNGQLIDPTGVILITRDPLKHAALFSQFLVDNGRIIQVGNESDLSPEEKKFVDDLKAAHIDASKFYKTIQFITPKIQNVITKTKERIKEKAKPAAAG